MSALTERLWSQIACGGRVAPVVMTPEGDGRVRRYQVTGAFNLSLLLSAAARGGKVVCGSPGT